MSCISSANCEKPRTAISPVLQVQDSLVTAESKETVNKILDHFKNHILSKNDANDNFVPNRDFNISAAKVVFSWLCRQFKNLCVDIEVRIYFLYLNIISIPLIILKKG